MCEPYPERFTLPENKFDRSETLKLERQRDARDDKQILYRNSTAGKFNQRSSGSERTTNRYGWNVRACTGAVALVVV